MASPRFIQSRTFKKAVITSGSFTLDQTAITALAGTSLVVSAQAGDEILYGVSGQLSAIGATTGFDVYTMVGGSRVNPFGAGLSASLASTTGVLAWHSGGSSSEHSLSGFFPKTVVAGDIEDNAVTCQLHYAKVTTTARTLLAVANTPLVVFAVNIGPGDPH